MESITKQTGSTVLSCEHSFHFRCIENWFVKQVWDDLPQTCPCCRSEGEALDRCEVNIEEGEEEDDEETYADAESETATDMPDEEELEDIRWERLGPGRWMIVSTPELALEGVRNLFGPLNELELEEDPPVQMDPTLIAVQKIQAIMRGHLARNNYTAVRSLMMLRS